MQILESPLGNEYLNGSLFSTLPPSSEMPRALDDEPRRDSLPPLPSHNSQPELNGPRSKTPLGLKRATTVGPTLLPSRHSSLPPTPGLPKKRVSAIGAASSHGRLFKVLADFFLLAGRLEEATIWWEPCSRCFLYRLIQVIGTTRRLFYSSLRKKHHGMPQHWRDWPRFQLSKHGLRHKVLSV